MIYGTLRRLEIIGSERDDGFVQAHFVAVTLQLGHSGPSAGANC